jgi:proteic killer suppression protein
LRKPGHGFIVQATVDLLASWKPAKPRSRELQIDKCKVTGYSCSVKIRSFAHKGLKKLYEDDETKGVDAATADKLRKVLLFLDEMEAPEELLSLPAWKAHALKGNRKGTWSLSVTANWRLTFCLDRSRREIFDLNLEDYH